MGFVFPAPSWSGLKFVVRQKVGLIKSEKDQPGNRGGGKNHLEPDQSPAEGKKDQSLKEEKTQEKKNQIEKNGKTREKID